MQDYIKGIKRNALYIAAGAVLLTSSGCATMSGEDWGGLIGAGLGAATIGKSDSDLEKAGKVIGGGIIGGAIGGSIDESNARDRKIRELEREIDELKR